MKYSKPNFIPMLESAGLDQTILTAFTHSVTSEELTVLVNAATGLALTDADINRYIGERGSLGLDVTGGSVPTATERPERPTDVGSDAGAVYCTPVGGTTEDTVVRWYVNSAPLLDKVGVYANSVTLLELGAGSGDTVTMAVVDNGVVGWWGKIELP